MTEYGRQSARAYTLREIEDMREAFRARIDRRFEAQFIDGRGSYGRRRDASRPDPFDTQAEAELRTALIGNADPADVLREIANQERIL